MPKPSVAGEIQPAVPPPPTSTPPPLPNSPPISVSVPRAPASERPAVSVSATRPSSPVRCTLSDWKHKRATEGRTEARTLPRESNFIYANTVRIAQGLGLIRTNSLIRPGQVPGPLDGRVAALDPDPQYVWTTANQEHIPEFPFVAKGITTRVDGRWGPQEYSRWPQPYHSDIIQHMCIPMKADAAGPSEIMWRAFTLLDWSPDINCGVPDLGLLRADVLDALEKDTSRIIDMFNRCGAGKVETKKVAGYQHIRLIRQCLNRLRLLPAGRTHTLALAAHVQRLVLELGGFVNLFEIVMSRLEDHSIDGSAMSLLPIRGAFTSNASIAQQLYHAGIPCWLRQKLTDKVVIFRVVEITRISSLLSLEPSWPQILAGVADLSGILSRPNELVSQMRIDANRLLAEVTLPPLVYNEGTLAEEEPPLKRLRIEEGVARDKPAPCKRARRRRKHKGKDNENDSEALQQEETAPTLSHPASVHLAPTCATLSPAWTAALQSVGTVAPSSQAMVYYFPPPWLVEADSPRRTRWVHNYVRIRGFLRQRIMDRTIGGQLLTIAQWKDALWGNYEVHEASSTKAVGSQKAKYDSKQACRKLFASVAALPSYSTADMPIWRGEPVTLDGASRSETFLREVIWELHEINWRCELRALDQELCTVPSHSRAWFIAEREQLIADVWGKDLSILDVLPKWQAAMPSYRWTSSPNEDAYQALAALLLVMARWKGRPQTLHLTPDAVMTADEAAFRRIQQEALDYYVRAFTSVFHRLPIAPSWLVSPEPSSQQ